METMFGSSLLPVVCMSVHVLFTLFVFVGEVVVNPTIIRSRPRRTLNNYEIFATHVTSQSIPNKTATNQPTTLCDKVFQWLATGRWFSLVSSSNKTDLHDRTEILLKVTLSTKNQQSHHNY
jgi:hypothetical protein